MANWHPLVWILAVVAIVLLILLAIGDIHAGAITAGSWSAAPLLAGRLKL